MFKTGSKFLYGLAAFGFVAAIAYAMATDGHPFDKVGAILGPLSLGYKGYVGDHVGFTILVGLAFTAFFLAVLLSALRDTDAEAVAQDAGLEVVPAVPAPATVNYWPVVAAFSAAAVVLGLAVGSQLFVVGLIGATAATFEWTVRAWSDRATGDPEVNRGIRNRLMHPIEVPAIAILGIGGFVLAISRILLALPKTGSYLVFAIVPALIFGVGVLIVTKPKLSQSVIAALLLVGGFAVLAGGVAAAIHGEREPEKHKTDQGEHRIAPFVEPGQTVIRVGN
ncbi:hypothetical protein [Aquihabitans sp. McL0605]|uniref:hypothetical protein n=1 Tax=Aquihabitans sp. McL0605 TaxID=3415671 RepID=UPI003CE9BB32